FFFFSSRRRHTRWPRDWSSDVCSSDLDYHNVIEAKLEKIDNFLREFGGAQKCYVDTGPILERDYAATAGIGWHGKSTMLIDGKQIGRASCRERVSNSVGGEAIKKKT